MRCFGNTAGPSDRAIDWLRARCKSCDPLAAQDGKHAA